MFQHVVDRISESLMGVSIFHKILGLGLGAVLILVAGLLYFTMYSLPTAFDDVLELRATSVRSLVASWVDQPEQVNNDLPGALRNLAENHHWVSGVRLVEGEPNGDVMYSIIFTDGNLIEEGTFPDPSDVMVLGHHEAAAPYRLSIQLPPDDVEDHQTTLIRTLWGLVLGTAVLGGLLAFGLAWLIVSPIRRLRQVTDTVRNGNLKARVPIDSGDEIGELAESFNVMIDRLETSLERLKHQVERRKELLEQLYSAQDDERARIARELHDDIGPTLSAVRFQIDNLIDQNPGHQQVIKQIQSIETKVRDLSRTLHPSTLEEGGLGEALAQVADSLAERYTGSIRVEIPDRTPIDELDNNARRTLFRVGQEALRNAIQHAEADQISLILRRDKDRVRLLVSDDGKGFDLKKERNKKDILSRGLGLRSMEERVSLYGGSLTIETSPGAGTLVRADLPLDGTMEASM